MDENQWIEQLKEKADSKVFRDVHFTAAMKEGVRQRIRQRHTKKMVRWSRFAFPVLAGWLLFLAWQVGPLSLFPGERHASKPSEPATSVPELLPGGSLDVPLLWKASPRTEMTANGQPFTYLGDKPVRVITDPSGFYEDQQQRVFWLLDAGQMKKVELVAYNSEGRRVELGTYSVSGPLFDAQHHVPTGVTLPDPGIWKLQVNADGKHLGQVFVVVKAGISPANRELVEPIIRKYLEREGSELGDLGKEREVTMELLGVEAPDAASRSVYAWVKVVSKDPLRSSGVSAPMAFQIAYNGSEYKVTGFQMPEDGNRYQSSLQQIFPQKVLERIQTRPK